MVNVGLIDVDSLHYPNLALMKISAYHKKIGDKVEWVTIGKYDITYMSKVFTFTNERDNCFSDLGEIIKGGTGYNFDTLPEQIDKMCPDYSIYPKFKEAYGFLTRGCPNKCSWCIVPNKEGNICPYADIEDFLDGRNIAILMDNNVLSHKHGLQQIEKIAKLKIKVDFNQGLDCRIISNDESIAELLGKLKWYKPLRMACDTLNQMEYIEKATYFLRKHKVNPKRYFIYVLVKDIDDAYKRVMFLNKLGLDPFAQPYRDLKNNTEPSKESKRFARWVNHKAIFRSIDFKNYKW